MSYLENVLYFLGIVHGTYADWVRLKSNHPTLPVHIGRDIGEGSDHTVFTFWNGNEYIESLNII